ncbi:nucleotide-binding universal stress UspA family protein [Haloactinopolyspora alba]|uniref:Nucleotide-binding universal stress UspA family protein n=1 Tax=Haloactinopolyspora alba TaxID=648780 RepID=A0A2P8EFK0_9ACTN|nr:universal stress protein [Haloactinopolyspora alba]PSL08233.1 nucleotide-binding universal stress UspA family protein [Haloactinopolyspora alba]
MAGEVFVGVDGSSEAGHALAWAAREADARGARLHVVVVAVGGDQTQSWSDDILDRAQLTINAVAPDVEVTVERMDGPAARVLAEAAASSSMLVVGRRGIGGFAGLLLGSVAHGVAQLAECPVVAVPAPEVPVADSVVVGVDGSEGNEAAIGFAFALADLHGARLRAVHTWTQPVPFGPADALPLVYDVEAVQADESRVLAESLAGWQDEHPDVQVESRTVRGHPVRTLDAQASDALAVVVGRRATRNRVIGLLGSVSHGLLHHARCPVAVVPPPA